MLAPAPAASASVSWDDPAGDTTEIEGLLRYPVDLLSVRAESGGDELRVYFETDHTAAQHFAFPGVDGRRTGGAPAELYLDLDDDPATGEEPFWASESEYAADLVGYEADVVVMLGFDVISKGDGSSASFGGDVIVDAAEYEIQSHWVDYWLDALELDADGSPVGVPALYGGLTTREFATWQEHTIELRIPYAWLGVRSGDVIRLMYREQDQGPASGAGYSSNRRLTLE
jgi:hypothetical protein